MKIKITLTNHKPLIAYIELTVAMFFLGVNVVTGKFLVASFPIFLLLGLRFLIGTITLFPILFLHEGSFKITKEIGYKLKWYDWRLLILQAFFGALLFNIFMLFGLKLSTATTAGILTSTTPAFTALLSFLFLAEHIDTKKLLAIIATIFGVIFININIGASSIILGWNFLGNSLIIFAVLAGAFLTVFIKLAATRFTPLGMSLFFNIFGFLFFLPLSIWDLLHHTFIGFDLKDCGLILLYSISGSTIFPVFWNRGISVVSASTASLFTAILPISTAFLAYVFLGEKITVMQILGMGFVLFAITIDICRPYSSFIPKNK